MSTAPVLDLSVQPDQLREQILAANPEPPRCALPNHGDPDRYRSTCVDCRKYALWRQRLYRRFAKAGISARPPASDPEPHCRRHRSPWKMRHTCTDCKLVYDWRQREYHRKTKAGISNRFTDLPRLLAHVQALEDAGMLLPDIARAADVGLEPLQKLCAGRRRWVNLRLAEQVFAVPVPERRYELIPDVLGRPRRRVDATGTARRIRCGQAEGHSIAYQAERLGWSKHAVGRWTTAKTVSIDIADAVKQLYPRLLEEPGTCAVSKGIAAREGWPRARFFSEANIDDPTYDPFRLVKKPHGVYRRLRALAFIAQGPAEVGAYIDEAPETVEVWMEGGPAPAYAHHLVAAAYEALSFTEGPNQEAADRARHADWGSPLAWEGVDIDKPTAQPKRNALDGPSASLFLTTTVYDGIDGRITRREMNDAEAVEVVTVLHRRGWSDRRIAVWLRWNRNGNHDQGAEAVVKFRERHGITGYGVQLHGIANYDAVNGLIFEPAA